MGPPPARSSAPCATASGRGRAGWHWKGGGRGSGRSTGCRDLAGAPRCRRSRRRGREGGRRGGGSAAGHGGGLADERRAGVAARTDWSLRGRAPVVVWPDADEPGRPSPARVGKARQGSAGANEVRIVAVPEGAPEGWDLADEPPEGLDGRDDRQGHGRSRAVRSRRRDPGRLPGALPPPRKAPGFYKLVEKEGQGERRGHRASGSGSPRGSTSQADTRNGRRRIRAAARHP